LIQYREVNRGLICAKTQQRCDNFNETSAPTNFTIKGIIDQFFERNPHLRPVENQAGNHLHMN
jgi:hypothetical protein